VRVPCIVMAGGRGSRLGLHEKGVAQVCGVPLLARVVSALRRSRSCSRIVVATTPRHGRTVRLAQALGVEVLLLPGDSYVEDLRTALEAVGTPALVVPVDIVGLTPGLVDWFTRQALGSGASVVTLEGPDGPVGVGLHRDPEGGDWTVIRVEDPYIFDVDTGDDLARANRLCA